MILAANRQNKAYQVMTLGHPQQQKRNSIKKGLTVIWIKTKKNINLINLQKQ